MKTAITVLQEMMMKLGEVPEYECVSQSGPQHAATFEYVCRARGLGARAGARSKREAKQEAARALLARLARAGLPVPPPYGEPAQMDRVLTNASVYSPKKRQTESTENENSPSKMLRSEDKILVQVSNEDIYIHMGSDAEGGGEAAGAGAAAGSYVMLLKELCEEYRMPAVEYELTGDTGPPHARLFTVRARIGQHARAATGRAKRAARNAAAELLYAYLRDHLRSTRDFVEETALARAHEKVMERWREARGAQPARPRLELRLADYHAGLRDRYGTVAGLLDVRALDAERRGAALAALDAAAADAEAALEAAASALGLRAEWACLARRGGAALHALALEPAEPPLAALAASRAAAARAACAHLRAALADAPGAERA